MTTTEEIDTALEALNATGRPLQSRETIRLILDAAAKVRGDGWPKLYARLENYMVEVMQQGGNADARLLVDFKAALLPSPPTVKE